VLVIDRWLSHAWMARVFLATLLRQAALLHIAPVDGTICLPNLRPVLILMHGVAAHMCGQAGVPSREWSELKVA